MRLSSLHLVVLALAFTMGSQPARAHEDWLVEAMRHGSADGFWTDMGSSVVDHLAEYADRFVVAENSVYHDPAHPSRVMLPVIPAAR